MSCRKSSWPSSVLSLVAALAARTLAASSGERCRTMAAFRMSMSMVMIQCSLLALAEPQRGEQQLFRGVHDLDVVLVRARGGDHVDHLLDDVDGGRVDVTLGVG